MKYILGILCFLIALLCLITSGIFSRSQSPPDPDKKDLRPAGILGFALFTFIGLGIIFG
jgi:hypothetical protein